MQGWLWGGATSAVAPGSKQDGGRSPPFPPPHFRVPPPLPPPHPLVAGAGAHTACGGESRASVSLHTPGAHNSKAGPGNLSCRQRADEEYRSLLPFNQPPQII